MSFQSGTRAGTSLPRAVSDFLLYPGEGRVGFSGSTLKILACGSMLIDHTGAAVVRTLLRSPAVSDPALRSELGQLYTWMRAVGRLAFPIFCFLLVEGFMHTRNVEKYARRLLLFALLSEFPFDFALKSSWFYPAKQNVYFTLLIGLLVMWGQQIFRDCTVLQALVFMAGLMAGQLLRTDYGYKGVFLIEVLCLLRYYRTAQCICGGIAFSYEKWAPLSMIFCWLYNGKRGIRLKYIFYFFYPAHLLVLGAIRHFVIPALG